MKKNGFGTKYFFRFWTPRCQKKPEPNVMDFWLRGEGSKKILFQFGPPRYQNDRNSIGNIIGRVFGPKKTAWKKLRAEKCSKMAFFGVFGVRTLGPEPVFFGGARAAPPGGKIFENFCHEKKITGCFQVREKKISGIRKNTKNIPNEPLSTPKRGGGWRGAGKHP